MLKKRFIIVFFSSFLFFLCGELYLRYYWGFCDNMLFCEDSDYEYIMQPDQNRYRFRNSLLTNGYAMRSDKVNPAAIKILGFGDSVLNGGVLTSHEELATTILSDSLSHFLNRDVQFLNISSPSWGPDNCFAYLKKHGNFDAQLMMLFVNSHDAYDNMSFHKVVDVHPSYPSSNYNLALWELYHRYLLPRFRAFLKGETYSHDIYDISPYSEVFNSGFASFNDYSNSNQIPLFIYIHPDVSEIEKKMYNENNGLILDFVRQHNIPVVEGLYSGLDKTHYYDKMHLNAEGQSKMAEIVLHFLKEWLKNKEDSML